MKSLDSSFWRLYDLSIFLIFSHVLFWRLRSRFIFQELHGKSQRTPEMSGGQKALQFQQKCWEICKCSKGPRYPQEDPESGRGAHRPRQCKICLDFRHLARKVEYKPKIRYLLQKPYDSLNIWGHWIKENINIAEVSNSNSQYWNSNDVTIWSLGSRCHSWKMWLFQSS